MKNLMMVILCASCGITGASAGVSCQEIGIAYGHNAAAACVKATVKDQKRLAVEAASDPFRQRPVRCRTEVLADAYPSVSACAQSRAQVRARRAIAQSEVHALFGD